jgi:hypothetical protein
MILDDVDNLIEESLLYELNTMTKVRAFLKRGAQSAGDAVHLLKTEPARLGSSVIQSVKPGITNMLGTGVTRMFGYGVDHKGMMGAANTVGKMVRGQTKPTVGKFAKMAWDVAPSNPALELAARTAGGVKDASKGWRLATRREGLNPDVQKALYKMNRAAV